MNKNTWNIPAPNPACPLTQALSHISHSLLRYLNEKMTQRFFHALTLTIKNVRGWFSVWGLTFSTFFSPNENFHFLIAIVVNRTREHCFHTSRNEEESN